jgi:hypothetical protein
MPAQRLTIDVYVSCADRVLCSALLLSLCECREQPTEPDLRGRKYIDSVDHKVRFLVAAG